MEALLDTKCVDITLEFFYSIPPVIRNKTFGNIQ
jgi:hypothetical protein